MKEITITPTITNRSDEDVLNRYFPSIAKMTPLSQEEEAELALRIRKGDRKAFDKLVCSNLRFVVSVAKKYQNQGLSLADLIEEGNIGLMKAAETFNENRGVKFITYAVSFVRQAIFDALEAHCRMIRLPHDQCQLARQIKKAKALLEQQDCRVVSAEEIAEELGLEPSKIISTMATSEGCYSLDAPLDEDDDRTLASVHAAVDGLAVTDETEVTLMNEDILYMISSALKEREAFIIKSTFGIDCDELKQEEIGNQLSLSRERVRQLRDNSLKKLREFSLHRLRLCS